MSTAIVFTNFSDETFVCSWDGTPYTFAPGQAMMVEDWKAYHFAKHLANREMQKLDKNSMFLQDPRRNTLIAKALPGEKSLEVEDESKLTTELLNQKHVCPECQFEAKSTAGLSAHMRKHDKVAAPVNEEEVFEE